MDELLGFSTEFGIEDSDDSDNCSLDDSATEKQGFGSGFCNYSLPPWLPVHQLGGDVALAYLREEYESKGVVKLEGFRINPTVIRRMCGELLARNEDNSAYVYPSVMSYERIQSVREVTRLENFVGTHPKWKELCLDILEAAVSDICGYKSQHNWCLYKEKLNIKPPGGMGFAPHLDAPSLQVTGLAKEFVTVMVAIDDMTVRNGCLRVVKKKWNATNMLECTQASAGDDPDRGGRAGAIPLTVADSLVFEDVLCSSGEMYLFNGYVPHRSGMNTSTLSRRAVFLTYNCETEGILRDEYYASMKQMRDTFKEQSALKKSDDLAELNSLNSIPGVAR